VRGNGNRVRSNGARGATHRAMYCACGGDTDAVVCRVLVEEGYEVVACPGHEALLERAINEPPDVIIYSLTPHGPIDRGVLQLVRRNFPKTPLLIVASEESSLETQRLIQEFRPTYFAVAPFDKGELRDAIRAARAQRERLTLGNRGAA
jgi:DNA-binding response OmpR family regulator